MSITKSKQTTWKLFSKLRRYEDSIERGSDAGYVNCCTCGAVKHWKEMDAGHFASGGKVNATKFIPEYVHNQCIACNRFKGGMQAEYALFMLEQYGRKKLFDLVALKHTVRKFTKEELKDMRKTFRKKIKKYGI